jgi:ribosomal protein L9
MNVLKWIGEKIIAPIIVVLITYILLSPEPKEKLKAMFAQFDQFKEITASILPAIIFLIVVFIGYHYFLRWKLRKEPKEANEKSLQSRKKELERTHAESVTTEARARIKEQLEELQETYQKKDEELFHTKALSKKIWKELNGEFEYRDEYSEPEGTAIFDLIGTADTFKYLHAKLSSPRCSNKEKPCYSAGLVQKRGKEGLYCPTCNKMITINDLSTFMKKAENALYDRINDLVRIFEKETKTDDEDKS